MFGIIGGWILCINDYPELSTAFPAYSTWNTRPAGLYVDAPRSYYLFIHVDIFEIDKIDILIATMDDGWMYINFWWLTPTPTDAIDCLY